MNEQLQDFINFLKKSWKIKKEELNKQTKEWIKISEILSTIDNNQLIYFINNKGIYYLLKIIYEIYQQNYTEEEFILYQCLICFKILLKVNIFFILINNEQREYLNS